MNYAPIFAAVAGTCLQREAAQIVRSAVRRWQDSGALSMPTVAEYNATIEAAAHEVRIGLNRRIEERLAMLKMRLPPVCNDPPFKELDEAQVAELERVRAAVNAAFDSAPK